MVSWPRVTQNHMGMALKQHHAGDVVYLDVLGNSILVLNSLEAINDLFDKQALNYSDRPTFTMVGELMGLDQVRNPSVTKTLWSSLTSPMRRACRCYRTARNGVTKGNSHTSRSTSRP